MTRRHPTVHQLKAAPRWYSDVVTGDKHVEVRRDDRGYQAGDKLLLREWSAGTGYTGRSIAATVDYVLRSQADVGPELGSPGIAAGFVAMAIACAWETEQDERQQLRAAAGAMAVRA